MSFRVHVVCIPSLSPTPEERQNTWSVHTSLLSHLSSNHYDKWIENIPQVVLILEKIFMLYFNICLVD